MDLYYLWQLVFIIAMGTIAQWVAWRLNIPSILLLLILGILAGPVAGVINPDEVFGGLLMPFVSLSIAIILFEGGLSLQYKDLRRSGTVILNLLSTSVMIGWLLNTLGAIYILNLSLPMALLFGAILVVSGPTVIIPILRQVKPKRKISSIIKWEGIVNDPVGAILAVLVFEAMLTGGFEEASSIFLMGIAKTLIVGIGIGVFGGIVMTWLLKRYHVPDFLQNPVILSIVLGLFAVSNVAQHESGLLTVTILGVILANQKSISITHIVEFKENLQVLLIASLFVVLASRLKISDIESLNWDGLIFLGYLIFVARPMAVFISTMGKALTWQERVFLSFMAPKGIVAAAVTSVFALELYRAGYSEAERLVPLMFLIIIGTVTVYGFGAKRLALWLKLASPNPQGVLILGCHPWACELAKLIAAEGVEVLMVDTNRRFVQKARLDGLRAIYGNIFSETFIETLNLGGIGRFMALTEDDETNSLAVIQMIHLFGRSNVYQVVPENVANDRTQTMNIRGRLLFHKKATYQNMSMMVRNNWIIKKTNLTEEFTFDSFKQVYGSSAIGLLTRNTEGKLDIFTVDKKANVQAGFKLIAITPPLKERRPIDD